MPPYEVKVSWPAFRDFLLEGEAVYEVCYGAKEKGGD
jgi:hypothetical protein